MTFQQLRYAIGIAENGSFNKAAEKLYLSQPALSMAVSKAERALGAPLFDRSRRPPTLTARFIARWTGPAGPL